MYYRQHENDAHKDPSPPRLATDAAHLRYACSEQTTKRASKGSGGEENCSADTEL
jgi:hypothetical protein